VRCTPGKRQFSHWPCRALSWTRFPANLSCDLHHGHPRRFGCPSAANSQPCPWLTLACSSDCAAAVEYTADRAVFFSLTLSQCSFGWPSLRTRRGTNLQSYGGPANLWRSQGVEIGENKVMRRQPLIPLIRDVLGVDGYRKVWLIPPRGRQEGGQRCRSQACA